MDLARIEIQTAAGSSKAEMTREGLKDHEAMRDFLYSRMRGARDRDRPVAHTPPAEEAAVGMLNQITTELRAIRTLVAGQRTRD
jgi:putative membrane protein